MQEDDSGLANYDEERYEKNAERRAMAIVHYLMDTVRNEFVPKEQRTDFVDFRQANNDEMIDFVKSRIRNLMLERRSKLNEYIIEVFRLQISVYAGKRNGNLATLQDLVRKKERGDKIVCEVCDNDITGPADGHSNDCELVKEYERVMV